MVKPKINKRISKVDAYLNCAENFAYRSTCIKRKYGAVIVKDDAVISTGYNGSPRGFENCCDIGECPRIRKNMHQGEGYAICRAVHAEANALLNCSREQTIGFVFGRRESKRLVGTQGEAVSAVRTHDYTGGNPKGVFKDRWRCRLL